MGAAGYAALRGLVSLFSSLKHHIGAQLDYDWTCSRLKSNRTRTAVTC
jgi:hypothetical protein